MICFYCNKALKGPGFCIAGCSPDVPASTNLTLLYTHVECFKEMAGEEIMDTVESVLKQKIDTLKLKK